MKRLGWIFLLAVLLLSTACLSQPQGVTAEVDDVTSATPTGEGWQILLAGVRDDEFWESDFGLWAEENHREMTLEKKGETHTYGGIPFFEVVAMVDDADGSMPYSFKKDLWEEGYDITLTAADGYSATFFTADVPADALLLATTVDGEPVSPRIVGNVSGKLWVRDLIDIELSLAPVALDDNDFTMELSLNGIESSLTLKEMESSPLYLEGQGTYTNSYGNSFTNTWGGVRFIPLLEEIMEVTEKTSIKIIAMDGYEMTYGGDMLLDQEDGEWILAFRENGEYMPEDPGYIRLVKVASSAGAEIPEITGHVSARMVKKIVSEGTPFKDFSLTLVQKDLTEVFDRQTMQSGVTTHKTRVSYYDRKGKIDIPYMGIPLWALLERPSGYKAIELIASDGFKVTLNNDEVEGNDDVIVAMFTGEEDLLLSDKEWPLRLVWDKNASVVPEGIKAVRNLVEIRLIY